MVVLAGTRGNENRSGENEEAIEQIRVSFRLDPSVKDRSLQVPKESIAVPATIRRSALSTVINHLLDRHVEDDDEEEEEDDDNEKDEKGEESNKLPSISFDFLIGSHDTNNQQYLRSSVQTGAKRMGLSLERDIILTYFPALPTPTLDQSSSKIPDWISCMSSSRSTTDKTRLLCTGSYDGNVRVYNTTKTTTTSSTKSSEKVSLEPIATLSAHQGPVKCLALTTFSDAHKRESFWIATGSLDQTLVVQQYHQSSKQQQQQPQGRLIINCQEGHTSSIGSVAFPRRDMAISPSLTLASGDWDGGLCIWDLQSHVNDSSSSNNATAAEVPPPSGKKHKSDSRKQKQKQQHESEKTPPCVTITAAPKFAIQAHASQISGICWNTNTTESLVTGSWDHSLKVWQVDRQDCVLTLNGSRVITCLDVSLHSPSVVVTGHPDCTIRLWDIRQQQQHQQHEQQQQPGLVVSDNTTLQPSHKEWITQVQWSHQNAYQLASTSYDGTLKLWDIRSPLPLSTIRVVTNKEDKALCMMCYDEEEEEDNSSSDRTVIFTGGTDGILHQYHL